MKKNKLSPKAKLSRERMLKSYSLDYNPFILKLVLVTAIFLGGLTLTQAQAPSPMALQNLNEKGIILDGYDPVAFFTAGKPTPGIPTLQFTYQGAIYQFSSQENLELFKANPEKYKPQFGGFCAYAVSLGRTAPIDVSTFSIVDGRLVLQHNAKAVAGWNKDVPRNLALADKYWPRVVANNGRQIVTQEEKGNLNNLDSNGVILQGYDAVAYQTENKAIAGLEKYNASYRGAIYWFISEDHAKMFRENPGQYAPQYGGFCGYAMSLGKLRPIDPNIFQLVNGRLILQHTHDAWVKFNKDVPGNTAKADANWPLQEKKHAGKRVKFDPLAQ